MFNAFTTIKRNQGEHINLLPEIIKDRPIVVVKYLSEDRDEIIYGSECQWSVAAGSNDTVQACKHIAIAALTYAELKEDADFSMSINEFFTEELTDDFLYQIGIQKSDGKPWSKEEIDSWMFLAADQYFDDACKFKPNTVITMSLNLLNGGDWQSLTVDDVTVYYDQNWVDDRDVWCIVAECYGFYEEFFLGMQPVHVYRKRFRDRSAGNAAFIGRFEAQSVLGFHTEEKLPESFICIKS